MTYCTRCTKPKPDEFRITIKADEFCSFKTHQERIPFLHSLDFFSVIVEDRIGSISEATVQRRLLRFFHPVKLVAIRPSTYGRQYSFKDSVIDVTESTSRLGNMSEMMIKLGRVGNATSLKAWDENGRSQICQIFISYGYKDLLNGLQFQYRISGALVLSDLFGTMDLPGASFKTHLHVINTVRYTFASLILLLILVKIKLDYPSEYITWVKIKESLSTGGGIQWLAFKTNLGNMYGPFPPTYRNYDSFMREHVVNNVNDLLAKEFDLGKDNQFGGFYGTSDNWRICSLGIYAQPVSSKKTT